MPSSIQGNSIDPVRFTPCRLPAADKTVAPRASSASAHKYDEKALVRRINADTLPRNASDSHLAVSAAVVDGARNLARGLENAKRFVRPVALAADAFRLGDAIFRDGGRIGARTISTGSEIACGWACSYAGGIVGSESGGALGAEIGSLVAPGAGTVIGGAIGGVLGGLSGSLGGGFAGAKLGDALIGDEE